MSTRYDWADASTWSANGAGDDELADDGTYGTCPQHGRVVLIMSDMLRCGCGSFPAIGSDISRPGDRLRRALKGEFR